MNSHIGYLVTLNCVFSCQGVVIAKKCTVPQICVRRVMNPCSFRTHFKLDKQPINVCEDSNQTSNIMYRFAHV